MDGERGLQGECDLEDHDLLIRLDEKMDMILKRLEDGDICIKDHEKRIGKLEAFQATLIGIAGTIAFAVGAFGSWLMGKLGMTS